ncbi:FUSC family protein [Streptomyces sp. FIT100]|uniref:FUSC family protein n=1 Tax=Streptomyces sp. FIT100 TaxID=2837956 RepID=UPI0021C9F099|nr:FUSC family protein [Streptomyces sp. FIT100]UUN25373.1 FUSC family protein [Streptomyces sp. FIT100]
MLKGMFVVPDPGRLRLRSASRSVLGIGPAVLAVALTGHSLPAVITGGLAALLALFTVTDATVRGQAVTTLLLPAAGLPVLALAAGLHDQPLLRDTAFLAVAGAGVYVRRWGPRGHALGVFAFMTFFVAQFLHTIPAQLPGLYSAVLLAVVASSAVRFGLWCYERRLAPPVVPALPAGTGLARTTTRQAVQVAVAGALALALGQLLSQERWYWAVGAAWWIFVNTASRGETLVRGFRRVLGTVTGIAVGLLVAVPVHGDAAPTAALVAVCVFGIFYTAAVSYSWMMFFVTVMVSLLYGLLGVLDPGLLALRLAETGVGALGAVVAVLLVLPVTTHATTDAWIQQALRCVHRCTAEAAARLAGSTTADPAPHVTELEALLGRVRMAVAPLVHPLSPMRARKARARQVLALLDECAREARGLAAVAADPAASHDARLAAACHRVEAAVLTLASPDGVPAPAPAQGLAVAIPAQRQHSGADAALTHLHGLERALTDLATPLGTSPRSPLIAV